MKTEKKAWDPPIKRVVFLLFLFIFVAALFDATSTLELNKTGDYYEVNPFARLALDVGSLYFILWRMLSMTLAIGTTAFFARRYRLAWWILLIIAASYLFISGYYVYHLFIFTP